MAINKIVKNSLGADAIDATKIADDAISEEHLDTSVIIGNAELAEAAASGDILLVYDTSAGTLKKILASNVGTQAITISSVSPTNALSGDGTGNHTFTITGANFTGASAVLVNNSGTEINFDSVTVNNATQITAVIAKSSLPGSGEPYDVRVFGSNGITSNLRNQINVDQTPVYVTAAGSLGTQTVNTAGSFSINATDPESAGNVTFELQSGSLPPGYSITNTAADGGTAIISGTDSTTSSTTTFNFVLRAVDAASNTSSRSFSITSRVIVTESFTSSGTFSIPSGVTQTDVLVIAGGGGGGTGAPGAYSGGGGGAGGLIFFPSYPITSGGTITVTVGCGGGVNTGGQNSVFGSPGDPGLGQGGVLTAVGGGGGGNGNATGAPGGAGGGAGGGGPNPSFPNNNGTATQPTQPGNSGSYGFGNNGGSRSDEVQGGRGGGGGGAGAVGTCGGAGGGGTRGASGGGGAGRAYTIADGTTPVYYAGGGGGGSSTQGQGSGGGGQGGGGAGGGATSPYPGNAGGQPGTANSGGGGGGGASPSQSGFPGGKGVVIVRY